MIYIGIDPGSHGALAAIDDDDNVICIIDLTNDVNDYRVLVDLFVDCKVVVEDVCGRPGQSCIANTTFMKLAGYAELLGNIYDMDMRKVKPQTWKKYYGLTTKGLTVTQRKHLSIDLAKRFFPAVSDSLTASKDGRAEALLLAKYCKETCDV